MLILLLFVIVDVMCIFDYFLYLCCLYGSEIYLKLKTKNQIKNHGSSEPSVNSAAQNVGQTLQGLQNSVEFHYGEGNEELGFMEALKTKHEIVWIPRKGRGEEGGSDFLCPPGKKQASKSDKRHHDRNRMWLCSAQIVK